MLSFLTRYHLLWFTLFCGSILLIPTAPPFFWLHLGLITYTLLYLFILFPLFATRNILGVAWSLIDIFFAGLIFFFFFFTPLYYYSTQAHLILLRPLDILLTFILIILACYLYLFFKKPLSKESTPHPLIITKEAILLFGTLALFAFLHLIYFHFYQFLPEWDGYTDILSIEKNIQDATFHQSYRAFFQASASILSALLAITPYHLFLFFFIPLQATPLLVLYSLFQKYNFRSIFWQISLYTSFLSLPIVALEIDMVRPQNILIISVPLIFYVVLLWEKEKQNLLLIPFFLILIAGLKYHEFFWFFLMATPALFFSLLYQKRALFKKPSTRILSILGTLLFLTLLFYLSATLQNFTLKVLLDVTDISRWRWWFLNNYNNSAQANTEVGWTGLMATIQYYAYYLSPVIVTLIILLATQWKKLISSRFFFQKSTLYFSLLLCVWVIFAEILPRLNSPFIPERYWLFFDLTLFFLFVSFILRHQKITFHLFLRFIIILSCVLGLGASVYLAYAKKSLTTPHEYEAALWLKTNTPGNAIIISQPGNSPFVQNFAKRKLFVPQEKFFTEASYVSPIDQASLERLTYHISKLEKNPTPENRHTISFLRKILAEQNYLKEKPLYILYSKEKFTTLYSKRGWYLAQNFYQARLEKFDAHLERVYDQNGITLWRIH